MNPNLAEAGKRTRFKPGQSGNRSGRPKQKPLTDELKKLLQEKAPGGHFTNAHMIANEAIQRAQAGDVAWARLVWEYVEGKPVQRVDLTLREAAERIAAERGLNAQDLVRRAEAIANGRA